jgi:hypothetical protein
MACKSSSDKLGTVGDTASMALFSSKNVSSVTSVLTLPPIPACAPNLSNGQIIRRVPSHDIVHTTCSAAKQAFSLMPACEIYATCEAVPHVKCDGPRSQAIMLFVKFVVVDQL